MFRSIIRRIRKKYGRKYRDINPEDIFIDSENLPGFESARLEGRIEQPMSERTFLLFKGFLTLMILLLIFELWILAVRDGEIYVEISENNRLSRDVIFANRGVIFDRNMLELATNEVKEESDDFALRKYVLLPGLSHTVGYVKYPSRDKNGIYYEYEYKGMDGVERYYDEILKGENGLELHETDVIGEIISESVIQKPEDGEPLILSLDALLTSELHRLIAQFARERGFEGGAGVIMDVNTGEMLALTSYPEYDQSLMTDGKDALGIGELVNSSSKPFLNRAIGGLYTPGSIIKPIIALGALNEGIISPSKSILSTGSISVPNPYDPSKPTVFRDWRAHGYTDMREALAVSSDVYFYSIGGGFGEQKGLGIAKIDKYLNMFGIAKTAGIDLFGEMAGIIPTPEWKRDTFDGDIWRLGDTYITSIGQYGTLLTPLSAARYTAAIANGGLLLEPTVIYSESAHTPSIQALRFADEDWRVVREGMRQGVTYGTSVGLNVPYVSVAAKTGTAEVGTIKRSLHSWSIGFFPYENPRYAFAIVMERGPTTNNVGATGIMRQLLDWMNIYTPEYFK